jgi:ketosteroid isomerase-like protein
MGRYEFDPATVASRMESSRRIYEAFNEGDIEAIVALMCPDVNWANPLQGGRERGHASVRSFWDRATELFDCRLQPLSIRADHRGRIVVDAYQTIRDVGGKPLAHQRMRHVFTFRGELIQRVDLRDPR